MLGMDAPQRMEGPPWDGGGYDESSDQRPETFDATIFPALADRRGWCWEVGVPKWWGRGVRTFKRRYDDAVSGKNEEAEAFTWFSSDILPADTIEHAKRVLPPQIYRSQFEASWENPGGLIYYSFSSRNVRPCKYQPTLPILVGSDFNVRPMAWVLCHKIGEELQVFDEIWINDTNTPATLHHLHRNYGNHPGGWEFYGDATGRSRRTSATYSDYQHILLDKRFAKFQRPRVLYPKENPPIHDRYAAVNARLKTLDDVRRIFIDPGCRHLIEDLSTFHYLEGTMEPEKKGDKSHPSDALGYLVHWLWPLDGCWEYVGDDAYDDEAVVGVGYEN